MPEGKSDHSVLEDIKTEPISVSANSKTIPIQVVFPKIQFEENKFDDFDSEVEAEISEFYKTVMPEEDFNSDEEWREDFEDLNVLTHPKKLDDPIEHNHAMELSARMEQLEMLSQSNFPCVFLTVHRMYESFEFQLWDVVPVATLKDLIEDLTEVPSQDMRLYLKNGTILDDWKMLKEYGIQAAFHHCESPAQLFVGFRANLEAFSDDEIEEEKEEGNVDFELSPGLEYFETVSDIDFIGEIERDRDFDDSNEDFDGTIEFLTVLPDNGAGYSAFRPFSGTKTKMDCEKILKQTKSKTNQRKLIRKIPKRKTLFLFR